MNEKIGRCHDCTAPQTEVNILSRHILELQADKGRLIDELTKAKEIIKELVQVEYADFTNGDYSNELSKVLGQAEQFLNEVGK